MSRRGEAFRRRDNIETDRAAKATVFQSGLSLLHQLAVAEDPSQDNGPVQEVVQDNHRISMRPPKPGGGCFAALAVQ
ncbi:hypothetical protein GCM10023346_14410 [Arthrobacter gyeryongensis]|uniref:Uncharacterized protein n=1 Tax=Arthrobacter gyeryongensis TaxID=1650592 RepID=A0ABP9S7K8_9MICC